MNRIQSQCFLYRSENIILTNKNICSIFVCINVCIKKKNLCQGAATPNDKDFSKPNLQNNMCQHAERKWLINSYILSL